MRLRRAHSRSGERLRRNAVERSRRCRDAVRDGNAAGLGWRCVGRTAVEGSRRPGAGARVRLRRTGGGWAYRHRTWTMARAAVRFFQTATMPEIEAAVAAQYANLKDLSAEWTLIDPDGGGLGGTRGGVPRSLLDPAFGGSGELPAGWQPLPWLE